MRSPSRPLSPFKEDQKHTKRKERESDTGEHTNGCKSTSFWWAPIWIQYAKRYTAHYTTSCNTKWTSAMLCYTNLNHSCKNICIVYVLERPDFGLCPCRRELKTPFKAQPEAWQNKHEIESCMFRRWRGLQQEKVPSRCYSEHVVYMYIYKL